MSKQLPYLNLGCGRHFHPKWVNVDFAQTGQGVIAHNLLRGIPFPDSQFEAVYHSHVLEHFSKTDGQKFLQECFRVLKPGGILRVAIPDLEQLARHYLCFLQKGLEAPHDKLNRANYDWIMLEMYDQTVRNKGGGQMGAYLFQDEIANENFVYERIGMEGKALRQKYFDIKEKPNQAKRKRKQKLLYRIARKVAFILLNKLYKSEIHSAEDYFNLGKFRLSGEIHQWMYDKYSLAFLLRQVGFAETKVVDATTSGVKNWEAFQLDTVNGAVCKPDSLFMEALKP